MTACGLVIQFGFLGQFDSRPLKRHKYFEINNKTWFSFLEAFVNDVAIMVSNFNFWIMKTLAVELTNLDFLGYINADRSKEIKILRSIIKFDFLFRSFYKWRSGKVFNLIFWTLLLLVVKLTNSTFGNCDCLRLKYPFLDLRGFITACGWVIHFRFLWTFLLLVVKVSIFDFLDVEVESGEGFHLKFFKRYRCYHLLL